MKKEEGFETVPGGELSPHSQANIDLEQLESAGQLGSGSDVHSSTSRQQQKKFIISSKTQNMLSSKKTQGETDAATKQLKMLVSSADLNKVQDCKQVVHRAKDFQREERQLRVSDPPRPEPAASKERPPRIDELEHFLRTIDEIIHADPINKHQVEVDQIDHITRVVNSTKGEHCRDVLRYISNLRRHFYDSVNSLDSLVAQASQKYARARDVQRELNNLLSNEIARSQKLATALRARDSENVQLKSQMEQLLLLLKERDNVIQTTERSPRSQQQQQEEEGIEQRDAEIMSISQRLEQELSSNKALSLLDRLKQEISSLQHDYQRVLIDKNQLEIEFEAQRRNMKYLDDKLAQTLTEREEQIVDLKAKIEIQKQKAKYYKKKLDEEMEQFKQETIKKDQQNCFKEKQIVELELAKLQAKLVEAESKIGNLEEQALRHEKQKGEVQKQHAEQLEQTEMKYQVLSDKMSQLESNFQNKLKMQADKTQSEQRKFEQLTLEQAKNELKLDYYKSNQLKVQQQKEFLESQIRKDIKEMQSQMLRTKLEIKKDQLISSQSAMARLEQMYAMMQQSLKHVTRVVSFMTFDSETQINLATLTEPQQEEPSLGKPPKAEATETNLLLEEASLGLTTEQLVQKWPLEMLEAMASWLQQLWQGANGPPTDDLDHLITQLKLRTNSGKVADIQRGFLIQNRIHYDQHIFRLTEKQTALQTERDRLQRRLQEMHEEMEEFFHEYGQETAQLQPKPEQAEAQIEGQTISPPPNLYQTAETSQQQRKVYKRQTQNNIDVLNTSTRASITKRLNEALQERVRDIKLILNRKYFELEDQMRMQKDKYEIEITQMRVQYGKDINQVNADNKKARQAMKREIDEQHKADFQRLKLQFSEQFKKLKSDFEDALKKINKEKMQERYQKQQYHLELQKQKQESCGFYQGGYGTFTIAFENPVYAKISKCQQDLIEHQQELDILKARLQGAKPKSRHQQMQAHQERQNALENEYMALQLEKDTIEILPLSKLKHFIEVGFQISSRNYQSLVSYSELQYESMTKKYVFEFQDQLDPAAAPDEDDVGREQAKESNLLLKENMLRQQISDNFALFNEISPIYISLNLGRPVTTFPDISLPAENFRLAHRISSNVSGQLLTINFLRDDQPFTTLRIIAFNNQTCQQFALDLNKQDLLVFVESNTKFLEEENSLDLFNMLTNSLTLISRQAQTRQGTSQVDVLTVEHRCFFNELYRNNWDARNKKIKARHNKFTQGLLKEQTCLTDFDQSVLFEGFEEVYGSECTLDVAKDLTDHFEIQLLRGIHSGHLKLTVKLRFTDVEQTLCLMRSPTLTANDQNKCQNLACALIQKPDIGDHRQAIAYIISMEKIYSTTNEENLVIKLTSLQKYNADRMREFEWRGDRAPNLASTKAVTEVVFLTKKAGEPKQFCRVKDFDILNTEVRAQLFSHSFGYEQLAADFGDLSTQAADSCRDLNTSPDLTQSLDEVRKNPAGKLSLPTPIEVDKQHIALVLRKFTIIRLRTLDENGDEVEESHYAYVGLYQSPRLLEQSLVRVEVSVPELDLSLTQDIQALAVITEAQLIQLAENKNIDQTTATLIDYLFLIESEEDGGGFTLELDPKTEAFSALMLQMKQSQFDETISKIGNVQFQLECEDPRALHVTQSDLVDCAKTNSVCVVGQRSFKLTCYFLPQLRGYKVKEHSLFDFDCIYVQAFSIALDQTFELVLTEHDIGTLVEMLQEATQHKTEIEYQINCKQLFNSSLSKAELTQFVMGMLEFDPATPRLYVSFEHLLSTMSQRKRLEIEFMETGGRFVKADPQVKQPEQQAAGSELTRILICNTEKDLSNSKIYIKVYKCSLASLPGLSKLQVEIYDIAEPSIVFKIDYLTSQTNRVGKQVLLERFSLVDHAFRLQNKDQDAEFNDNGINRGLIFCLSESPFPHEVHMMLLEPCSHIFWHNTMRDDSIGVIERRADRQAFAVLLEKSLQSEIMRDLPCDDILEIQPGYQQRESKKNPQAEILLSRFSELGSKKQGDLDLVYGRTLEYPSLDGFAEIQLSFSHESSKLSLEWIEKSAANQVLNNASWQVFLTNQASSCRYYQGILRSKDGTQLICQIEQAAAQKASVKCLRVSIQRILDQKELEPLFNLVIADPRLLKPDFSVREEQKFELGVGYKDSISSVFKMEDLSVDIMLSRTELPAEPPKVVTREEPWTLIHRKVVRQNDSNYIVSAMKHKKNEMFKLNVFQSHSMQQQIFVFNHADVFTLEEVREIQENPKSLSDLMRLAINQRLKIRELHLDEEADVLQSRSPQHANIKPRSEMSKLTFSASFLNPQVVQNQKSNDITLNQLFPGIEEFDIRKECTNSIFEPVNMFDSQPKPHKYTLLAQYQRDDYLFDVHQVLDPFEVNLKVQAYCPDTFQLVASAFCKQVELKRELATDHMAHLMEGQRREELAQYLINNSQVDERRQLMLFRRSEGAGANKLRPPT